MEYGEKYFSWQKFGVNLCKQVECTKLINAFPDFEKVKNENIKWKKEIYFLLDIHFNKNGNKILANKIINEVFDVLKLTFSVYIKNVEKCIKNVIKYIPIYICGQIFF